MPRHPTSTPPNVADALDQLRELVEADGRSVAEIADCAAPPLQPTHLHAVLSGRKRDPSIRTVARILAALRPPRSWADLD